VATSGPGKQPGMEAAIRRHGLTQASPGASSAGQRYGPVTGCRSRRAEVPAA